MIVTYHPEGSAEPTVWTVNLGKFRAGEMEAIEDVTKMAFGTEYRQALYYGNARARRALLWTLQRRDHPVLKIRDVDFADDELKVELDKSEWAALRAQVVKASPVDDPQVEQALQTIDVQIADAPEAPGKAPTPSPPSETSTD